MSYLESMFSLAGKTAIVTGAGRGIGQVVARGLASAGAEIAILCRHGAEETIKLIESDGNRAYYVQCDVTDEKQVDVALAEVMKRSGHIDILFNNAGICMHQTTMEATIAEFREVIDVNLTGEFIMARAVGKIMIDNKIKGVIVNMASMSGSIVNVPQWQVSYNASKAGVIHMTRSLAAEWVPYGIRVNSLSPGYIATPMSADAPKDLIDAWMPIIPMHRMGKPEELMPAVLYLCSDQAGYTSGQDVIVDGVYTCI